jgi:hypothetical protein
MTKALEKMIGSAIDLEDSARKVTHALSTDDEEHKLIDMAYDEYEGVIEELKDKIFIVDTELDDHLKMCADLRSDLIRLTKEVQRPMT